MEYCLFTVEHIEARRIYIRGVADITQPIDDYSKIIEFYHGNELKPYLPPNPYNKNEKDYQLFNELLSVIKSDFEDLGDNIVSVTDDERFLEYNHADNGRYILDTEKVII